MFKDSNLTVDNHAVDNTSRSADHIYTDYNTAVNSSSIWTAVNFSLFVYEQVYTFGFAPLVAIDDHDVLITPQLIALTGLHNHTAML